MTGVDPRTRTTTSYGASGSARARTVRDGRVRARRQDHRQGGGDELSVQLHVPGRGAIHLRTGVGELGIPLSPATLVLPRFSERLKTPYPAVRRPPSRLYAISRAGLQPGCLSTRSDADWAPTCHQERRREASDRPRRGRGAHVPARATARIPRGAGARLPGRSKPLVEIDQLRRTTEKGQAAGVELGRGGFASNRTARDSRPRAVRPVRRDDDVHRPVPRSDAAAGRGSRGAASSRSRGSTTGSAARSPASVRPPRRSAACHSARCSKFRRERVVGGGYHWPDRPCSLDESCACGAEPEQPALRPVACWC